jgi:orotidine-5'-phosphate decarboxylase
LSKKYKTNYHPNSFLTMNRDTLFQQIKLKKSYLCVGLDTDLSKIPQHLLDTKDPIFAFNRAIIDATRDLCVAYKPNLAFYEAEGLRGWQALEKTVQYIGNQHFIIADAKRGDIGNTSKLYAKAFFEQMDFDAITVAPYMGEDSVTPFFEYTDKWVILLGLTSNRGSSDFQLSIQKESDKPLFQTVMEQAQTWGTPDNLMFVIGATHPEKFKEIRAIAPDNFFLVPGVGAQGGDLEGVSRNGMNATCGLLVNSSREIIYASTGEDFATKAREKAMSIQKIMGELLDELLPN